jgi:DNA-binding SARP family transcriptional activator
LGDEVEPPGQRWDLRLLGEFQLTAGSEAIAVSGVQERLLAFLALKARPVRREVVAASLWGVVDGVDGSTQLRNAVWRLGRAAPGILETTRARVAVASSLTVDLDRARAAASLLTARDAGPPPPETVPLLDRDLLPDWHDEWVVIERERFCQLRLHALEASARALTSAGRYGEAIGAAGLAVDAQPLRESAHRVLIEAHIAEGNWGEALRQYDRCVRILHAELGLGPTPALTAVLAPALRRPMAVPGRPEERLLTRATSG